MVNFSFIVLFHNNDSTDYVIDSILKQFIQGDEIIVVDDHSSSENLKMFDRFNNSIKIVHSDRKGNRGYNRNYGAANAQNEYFFFVDGDIIFLPNAIMAMRESMGKGNVGAVGNVICSGNTLPQMNLITGIDYINLIRMDLNIENIIKLNIFYDDRHHLIYDKIALNTVWECFYTAYCAVKASAFEEVGGFETQFVGWGVEDDELGYRLHLKGKLEYNLAAYAVHVPHKRNLFQCLISNRINLYRFLAKFPSNQIALHMTFGNTIKMEVALKYIKSNLIAKNTYIYDFPKVENCIYVNELTKEYPEGYVCFNDLKNDTHILELYGVALPFKDNNFKIAFTSENLFAYPETFCAAILSEMLRIAWEVRIIKVKNPIRVMWNAEQISGLRYMSTSGRIVYSPVRIRDFDIIEYPDYYEITDGIALKMNDHFCVHENFYHPELFQINPEHYILINLAKSELTQDEKNILMDQYGIIIDSCYNVNVNLPDSKIRLTEVLYGDLYRLHAHIIYLIPYGYNIIKDDKWWEYPHRQKDLVIQKI